eukprot:UN25284
MSDLNISGNNKHIGLPPAGGRHLAVPVNTNKRSNTGESSSNKKPRVSFDDEMRHAQFVGEIMDINSNFTQIIQIDRKKLPKSSRNGDLELFSLYECIRESFERWKIRLPDTIENIALNEIKKNPKFSNYHATILKWDPQSMPARERSRIIFNAFCEATSIIGTMYKYQTDKLFEFCKTGNFTTDQMAPSRNQIFVLYCNYDNHTSTTATCDHYVLLWNNGLDIARDTFSKIIDFSPYVEDDKKKKNCRIKRFPIINKVSMVTIN